ncbi:MAG: hypothetical protein IJ904_04120 [Candidatus Methanomethylophilaceae archaeon]|nr:hypothetical protein [Candidatus Methanomethylophilaceae archaeon]
MDNKERIQRGCWVALIAVIVLLGFIGGAGSLNYAHFHGNGLFAVGGVGVIAIAVYAAVTVYQRRLKSPKL